MKRITKKKLDLYDVRGEYNRLSMKNKRCVYDLIQEMPTREVESKSMVNG